jgi:hypothetical protein
MLPVLLSSPPTPRKKAFPLAIMLTYEIWALASQLFLLSDVLQTLLLPPTTIASLVPGILATSVKPLLVPSDFEL